MVDTHRTGSRCNVDVQEQTSMKRYQLASDFWDGPSLVIWESNDREDRIATFPIEFLRTCGDNTWSYIYRVVIELISVEDITHLEILDDKGSSVDRQMEPLEGVYFLSKSLSVLVRQQDVDLQTPITRWSSHRARNTSQPSKHQTLRGAILLVRTPSARV